MKTRTTISMLLILATLGVQAAVWRVNNNAAMIQNCNFCALQVGDAISQANPGDTIHVEASSVEYDMVTINKEITIIGPGYFLDENVNEQQNWDNATINGIRFEAGSSNSKIMGLVIGTHIFIGAPDQSLLSGIKIIRCYIDGFVNINHTGLLDELTIKQCKIEWRVRRWGGWETGQINGLFISNNYVRGFEFSDGESGVITQNIVYSTPIDFYSDIEFFNNICTGYGFAYQNNNNSNNIHHNVVASSQPPWLTGGSNFFDVTGTFTPDGSTEGAYVVANTCVPCNQGFNGGTNNLEMGMYGGAEPYVRGGFPRIPSIYQLQNVSVAYPGGNVSVELSTKIHDQ